MSNLGAFKSLVRQCCGLHFEGLAETRLSHALNKLQAHSQAASFEALYERLTQDSDLLEQLVSLLTINETYFFREPEALNWLAQEYLPRRLAEHGAPVSILSAGCSSGEEPYSLAMALSEQYGERAASLFRIVGGDVDQQMVAKARAGLYSGLAFRALPPWLKDRYFSAHGNRWLLSAALRQWVSFHPLNLLDCQPTAFMKAFDVILFRNVSIYFDEATRQHLHHQLSQLLAPGGILLCGVTETLGNDLGVFELVDTPPVFYFRHRHAPADTPTPTDGPLVPPARPTDQAPRRPDTVKVAATHDESPPAASAAPSPPSLSDQLDAARQSFDQSDFATADALLTPLLAAHPWSPDVLLLAGLVARWQQQPRQALAYFKQATYVSPECWPAHFYRAELYRQGALPDMPSQRQRGYAAVVRLLSQQPTSPGGLRLIDPPLPPGDARFLAERYLQVGHESLGGS